jgi:hypothetical protein
MSDFEKAYGESQQRAALFNASQQAAVSNSGMLMPGPIQLASDPIAERLDELADLAEVWKRRRQARQSTDSVRDALLNACGGVALIQSNAALSHEQILKIQEEWKAKYDGTGQQSFSDMTDKSRVDRFGR